MIEGDIRPWERQSSESNESFEAFTLYLSMGQTRALSKVAGQLGKSHQLIERWSQRDAWRRRVLAYDRMMAREVLERVVVGQAYFRERVAQEGANMRTRAAARILKMSDEEIAKLPIREVIGLARTGTMMEHAARTVSAEELALQEREDVPRFQIRFLQDAPEEMVAVRLEDGTVGYIPLDAIPQFKTDYPSAVVVA